MGKMENQEYKTHFAQKTN